MIRSVLELVDPVSAYCDWGEKQVSSSSSAVPAILDLQSR